MAGWLDALSLAGPSLRLLGPTWGRVLAALWRVCHTGCWRRRCFGVGCRHRTPPLVRRVLSHKCGAQLNSAARTAEASSRARCSSVGELSSGLGAYPHAEASGWPQLTEHVSESVLLRANLPMGTVVVPDDAATTLTSAQAVPLFSLARAPRFFDLRKRRETGMSAAEVPRCVQALRKSTSLAAAPYARSRSIT